MCFVGQAIVPAAGFPAGGIATGPPKRRLRARLPAPHFAPSCLSVSRLILPVNMSNPFGEPKILWTQRYTDRRHSEFCTGRALHVRVQKSEHIGFPDFGAKEDEDVPIVGGLAD